MTLPKQEHLILNSMTQTKEKWDSLVLNRANFLNGMNVPWHSVFMVLHISTFLFRITVQKNAWMRAISVTVLVIILELQFLISVT